MKRNLNKSYLTILVISLFLISPSVGLTTMSDAGQGGMIEKVEKAILKASEMFEQGNIKKGKPYTIDISPEIKLSFSEETFDKDIEKAFKILDQMVIKKKTEKTNRTVFVPEQGSSIPDSQTPSPQGQADDRINAIMQAEKQTDKGLPQPEGKIPPEYSVYKNYQQARQEKVLSENKSAEADMQAVIAERQAAAQNLQRKREREQQLQAQATKWQDQLDKQASASARAAAAWEAEHSFGAYAKRFLGMVIQTSVGALTGGFLGTVSTNLANQAVKKMFPDASTNPVSQATAAGTSAAITNTATGIGQTATTSIGGSFTNQNQSQNQPQNQVAEPAY